LGDGEVDAGKGHQELDPIVVVGLSGERIGKVEDLSLDVSELAEIAVECLAAERVEVELREPGEGSRREQVVMGGSMRRW